MDNWIKLNNDIMIKDDDGNYSYEKDKEAVKAFFLENINKNTIFFYTLKEKLKFLIDNNYYVDLLKMYKYEDIKKLYTKVYNKKFRFTSYIAAFKFYTSYALMENSGEKYLERYEDRICCASLFLGDGNIVKANLYAEVMISQDYQPATPTFLNAGLKRGGKLVSCNLIEIGDSLNDIGYAISAGMKLSANGAGVSFNLSKIRSRQDPIRKIENRASGVLPVMKLLEDAFSYADQLGQRPGAASVYLHAFHRDIEEFISCKKVNVDEKIRMKSLSIAVVIPDKLMQLAEQGKHFYTFSPYYIKEVTGKNIEDIDWDKEYQALADNPDIPKTKIDARKFLTKIASTQKESGYPYIMFVDNARKVHNLDKNINFSNLCTEIIQYSSSSKISDDRLSDTYGMGISCVLGSLNIVNVMEHNSIQKSIEAATYSLSKVSDITDYPFCKDIDIANKSYHSIGIGAMNLHGFFAKNFIMFESKEALEFVDTFFMLMNYWSLYYSNKISKETGKKFLGFNDSKYASGEYINKYKETLPKIESDKIKWLFKDVFIPSIKDWDTLKEDIKEYGLYNAYRLAIAPNQSTGYIMSSTASVMPVTDPIEIREYGNSTTYYPMPYLTNDNIFFYKSAYDMDQNKVIKLISVMQKHIDQGISCILHKDGICDTKELARHYIVAWKLGLKTLYYTRSRKTNINECISCSA